MNCHEAKIIGYYSENEWLQLISNLFCVSHYLLIQGFMMLKQGL